MTARLLATWSALIALVIASAAATPQRGQSGAKHAGPPAFAKADHFDRSPALRDLPRRAPRSGLLHEAPDFRHLSGPKQLDPVVQSSPMAPLLSSPAVSFEGIGNLNGVLPPDTEGDVGPNHYVQWVNLSFAVYAKGPTGSTPTLIYGPVDGTTLWTGFGGPCETSNNGDPVVRYDHLADRWLMSQLALPNAFFGLYLAPFYQCIAVSATPDPTGPYYRYQYSFNNLNDYPKFGVWPDAYYMTMNEFKPPLLSFAGQGVIAFDRNAMLQGQPANMVFFDLGTVNPQLGGMLPSDLDGPLPPAGAPNYFMEVDDDAWGFPQDQLELWRFHVDWTTPSNSTFTQGALMATAPFDSNLCGGSGNCVPQPGTTQTLDTLSDRLMYRIQYRNFGDHESLVVNHTVDVDGTDHAGIRWYEVRDPGGSPFIYQQGTFAPDSDHRWMGSVAMDGAGNMALGYSVSSSTTYPSIRYTARLSTDPLGMMGQGETTLVTGSGSETHSSGRWGDYSMMVVDPSDDCTFWYTQEYFTAGASSAGWQTRIGAFSLPSCSVPNSVGPVATVGASVPKASEIGPTNGQFTVSRTGDTTAPLTISYTVGGTAVPDTDYVSIGASVTIPAGASSVNVSVVPDIDATVEPDETVILTLSSGTGYAVGSPAAATVTIVANVPPDLVVSALTAPALGGANATVAVTDTTKNQGTGPAPATVTSFYLSKDATLSSDDTALGSRAIAALAPGASDSGSTTVTIPAGTATGHYFIIANADATRAVTETQEGNNTKSVAITIGPDLTLSSVTAPAVGGAGGTINVTDTVLNQGGGAADPSTTAFYLSANFSLDASDALLGSRAVPSVASGASNSGTTTLTIPAGTAAGVYYVIGVADSANAVVETSETNNTKFSAAVKIGPDLVVSSVTVPTLADAGAAISITDTTTNQGGGDAPATKTGFYLSTNTTIDAADTFLGFRSAGPLAAGTGSSGTTSLAIPPGTATGTYYVIAAADYDNQVAETTEGNNARSSGQIRVGPDLVETSASASPTGAAGGTITITDTVKNQGLGDAGASTTGFYYSTSIVFSSAATRFASRPVPALPAGTSNTASTQVVLPANLATGTYYVFAGADADNQVPETLETNNTSGGQIVRVGPDLVVSAFSPPASIATGVSINVSSAVLNQGAAAAAGSTLRVYLSPNLTLDSSDVPVGVRTVGALNGGQSDIGTVAILIPTGTTPGSYYLIAVADDGNTVPETNETNNTRAAFIRVTAGSGQ